MADQAPGSVAKGRRRTRIRGPRDTPDRLQRSGTVEDEIGLPLAHGDLQGQISIRAQRADVDLLQFPAPYPLLRIGNGDEALRADIARSSPTLHLSVRVEPLSSLHGVIGSFIVVGRAMAGCVERQ